MNYRTARALYPNRPNLDASGFLVETLPLPVEHPELPLFETKEMPLPSRAPLHAPGSLADPIPARMMNEFVYCPRLFYYEHMEGVFAESADTQRGSALHDKVDRGRGALKKQRAQTKDEQALEEQALERRSADEAPPDDSATSPTPEKIIHSRLATLGSERLGVVAKLDLIEVRVAAELSEDLFSRSEVQRVTPVEYKVGAPREGAEGIELWPTDQMQLGLQILILRDNGYTCDEGVLYCHATRQRVRLAMTTELEAWILREIAAARLWRSPMTYHRPCKAPPSACAAHSHQFAYQMRRW